MDFGLHDKTALVLGGSQGLGWGVARSLLQEGARVAISSRSLESLNAARATLDPSLQERCMVIAADLGSPSAPAAIVEAARGQLGAVDILVNNSGGPPTGMPSGVTMAEMKGQFDKMVEPLLAITLALLPEMRMRKWGRVLTIASSGVVQPIPHLPISNSLRASLVAFMKTLAGEVARDGVTVNVLAPGRIATDRTQSIDATLAKRTNRGVEDVAAESAAAIPAGRYGTVEEFGSVAAFLASTAASYVTGSIIRVDGGSIRSI
ncbi:MAG: SDR family oxidoreductase [Devosia sp.]|nr:SDR family oxidoreductase [Devosia sp.]